MLRWRRSQGLWGGIRDSLGAKSRQQMHQVLRHPSELEIEMRLGQCGSIRVAGLDQTGVEQNGPGGRVTRSQGGSKTADARRAERVGDGDKEPPRKAGAGIGRGHQHPRRVHRRPITSPHDRNGQGACREIIGRVDQHIDVSWADRRIIHAGRRVVGEQGQRRDSLGREPDGTGDEPVGQGRSEVAARHIHSLTARTCRLLGGRTTRFSGVDLAVRSRDVHSRYGSGNDQALDLRGPLEDRVGPCPASDRCRWMPICACQCAFCDDATVL